MRHLNCYILARKLYMAHIVSIISQSQRYVKMKPILLALLEDNSL